MEQFLQFIEDEMQRRDMSIREFSRLCKISPGQVSNVLNGTRSPGLEFIKKISEGTNTPISHLVALIFPEQATISPEVTLLADRIRRLNDDDRQIVEAFVLGLALKRLQEQTDRGEIKTVDKSEDVK